MSKSNVSTSNFSNINPNKNIKTIESYEDFTNKFIFLERIDDSEDGESFSVQEVTDDETLRILAKNIKLD